MLYTMVGNGNRDHIFHAEDKCIVPFFLFWSEKRKKSVTFENKRIFWH